MAKITADFGDVQEYAPVPKDIYTVRIHECIPKASKSKLSTLLDLTFVIEGGDYDNRRLKAWPVVAGSSRAGEALIPRDYAKIIEATGVDWECEHCHATGPRPFQRGTGPVDAGGNGLLKGKLYCPDCLKPMKPSIETNDLIGKRLLVAVVIETMEGSDTETNRINDYQQLP